MLWLSKWGYVTDLLTGSTDSAATTAVLGFSDALRGLRERITRTLTDATRNNPLVYYRDSRTTRFSLPPYGSTAIAKLIAEEDLGQLEKSTACLRALQVDDLVLAESVAALFFPSGESIELDGLCI